MRTKPLSEQVKESANKKEETAPSRKPLFSTGSTEFNLACSDRVDGAFAPGTMVNIIGDSFAGKTVIAHSIMAEAKVNPAFAKYRFIYDNKEAADNTGIRKLFGSVLDDCIEPAPCERGYSVTIEDFQSNIIRALRKMSPCIYVEDSLDAITSEAELDRLDKRADGKEIKGSYGMERAKGLKQLLRVINDELERTDSLLIIISQTIQNIDPMAFAEKKRAGGEALKFFAAHEIWLGLREKINRNVNGKDRMIGAHTRVRVTKNRETGKMREADFRIYNSYGIDDLGDCVDFMVREKFWTKSSTGVIDAMDDLKMKGTRENLIRQIEEKGKEDRLRRLVGRGWREIEDKLKLTRKPRYR